MDRNFTKGKIASHIIMFAIPIVIGNLFQQLYSIADSIIVGKFIGSDALAAVGTSIPIMFLVVSVVAGFGVGTSIIVSQYYGADKHKAMRQAVSTSIIFIVFLGVLLSLGATLLAEPMLRMLSTPDEILKDAIIYLRIVGAGIIVQCFFYMPSAILRGVGDSRTPLVFLIIAAVLNIVLDLLFVGLFNMGVAGVGYATVMAQTLSSVMCICYVYKKYDIFKFTLKQFVFDKEKFSLTLRYGIPSSVQLMVNSVSMLLLQNIINGYGAIAMAAYASAYKINNLILVPAIDLGTSLSNFTAQNIGARNDERVKKGLYSTLRIGIVFAIVCSVLMLLFSKSIIGLFVKKEDVEIINLGANILNTLAPLFIVCVAMNIFVSFFKGAGDMKIAMILSILMVVVRTSVSYYLTGIPAIGIRGVWLTMPLTWCINAIISIWYYRRGSWKKYALE